MKRKKGSAMGALLEAGTRFILEIAQMGDWEEMRNATNAQLLDYLGVN